MASKKVLYTIEITKESNTAFSFFMPPGRYYILITKRLRSEMKSIPRDSMRYHDIRYSSRMGKDILSDVETFYRAKFIWHLVNDGVEL